MMHSKAKDAVQKRNTGTAAVVAQAPQKFDVDFSLDNARIDTSSAFLAAFAACLKQDESGALCIDAHKRQALLMKYTGPGQEKKQTLYHHLSVGALLITSTSWYRTPPGEWPECHDELGYVDPNLVLLVVERCNSDGGHSGFQLLSGKCSEHTDTRKIAADSAMNKLSFMNGYRIPPLDEQKRNAMLCRFTGAVNMRPHFLARAVLSKESLEKLRREQRLAPQVIEFYQSRLQENEKKASGKAKEISALEIPFCDTFALHVDQQQLWQLVNNDQRFYPSAKGPYVRPRLIRLVDALYPQNWLDRSAFYNSIIPQLYNAVEKNPSAFKAYLRQAVHRIMQLMRADILAQRWPSHLDMTQSDIVKIYAQWLSHVQIDFAGHFNVNHFDFSVEYATRLGMTAQIFSEFLQGLASIAETYDNEMLGFLAAKLGRDTDIYPMYQAAIPDPEHYWALDEKPSDFPKFTLIEQAPPCEILIEKSELTKAQENLVALGQRVYVRRSDDKFYIKFRLQRGGVAEVEINVAGFVQKLSSAWEKGGSLVRDSDLWRYLVNEVIVVNGGCYPARYAATAPMNENDILKNVVLVRKDRRSPFEPGFDLELYCQGAYITTPKEFFAALLACVMIDKKGKVLGIDVAKRHQLVDRVILQRGEHDSVVGALFFDFTKCEDPSQSVDCLGIERYSSDLGWQDLGCLSARNECLKQLQDEAWISAEIYAYYHELSQKIGDAVSDIFYLPISAVTRSIFKKLTENPLPTLEMGYRARLLKSSEMALIAVGVMATEDVCSPEVSTRTQHAPSTSSGSVEIIYSPDDGSPHGYRHLDDNVFMAFAGKLQEFSVNSMVIYLSDLLGDGRKGDYYREGVNHLGEKLILIHLNKLPLVHERLEAIDLLYVSKMLPEKSTLYQHRGLAARAMAYAGLFPGDTNTFTTQLKTLRKVYVDIAMDATLQSEQMIGVIKRHLFVTASLINTDEADRQKMRAIVDAWDRPKVNVLQPQP